MGATLGDAILAGRARAIGRDAGNSTARQGSCPDVVDTENQATNRSSVPTELCAVPHRTARRLGVAARRWSPASGIALEPVRFGKCTFTCELQHMTISTVSLDRDSGLIERRRTAFQPQ